MRGLKAVYEKRGDWWIGYVEDLPGANTQGRTLEEARRNLEEAIRLVLELSGKSDQGNGADMTVREDIVLEDVD